MNTISLCSGGVSDITIVSNIFIDKYMPAANGSFVKVYLYLLRILSDNTSKSTLSISSIADQLDHTETDVLRALTYWEKINLISLGRSNSNEINSITINPLHPTTTNQYNLYSQPNTDNTNSAIQDAISCAIPDINLKDNKDLSFVISIAEKYVERMLSPNDEQLILYLYSKANFSPDLILELYEYCASQGKKQYRYIESVASAWVKDGIKSASQAKANSETFNSSYSAVIKEFGINRSLGQAEKNYIDKWTKTYGFNTDIIKKACGKTLINIQKPDFKYTDRILSAWHQQGLKTISDIDALDNKYAKQNGNVPSSKKQAKYSTPKTTNKFNSFTQRNYTTEELDELERRLLSR